MKVYILNNGWLECDLNWMVSLAVVGSVTDKTPQTKWVRIPVYAVLIDHPDGKILYDTGCHPDAMAGYWPAGLQAVFPYFHTPEQTIDAQLALCGTTVNQIKTVVLSHMHCDHAGNLHRFRQAEVLAPKADWEYARQLVKNNPDPASHGAYIKADVEQRVNKINLVEQDVEIAHGVKLVNLPGHTPGLLGLLVTLADDQNLLFPQDAVYTPANYGPPVKASGIVYDSLNFVASMEKVRRLAAECQAQVMFSHDEAFFKNLRKAPAFYR